ncbi:hypothetical protein psyc5s11_18900 [Clostridium gelidum]|uniref:Uncharacterized protein n=1 Tax=Clostridium gelidum TaxID=704125 RepID=A0ABN6IW67_9CLOT|nr:hypothetical protein [Clostridium gelidum]BCZ45823.1 hypothetical protein psyc5s11_18900 [Clostridium gelidum]
MNNYIFLTDEGYTYQPNTESDVPDIENLQVIGISCGENEEAAFNNLMAKRRYLLSTSFDEIFCYKLASDYKDSYMEFSINNDYSIEKYKDEDYNLLIVKIKEDMDLDLSESYMVLNAIYKICKNNPSIVKDIIMNELYCNYYLYVNSYYELSCMLCDDDGLWTDIEFDENLYEFLLKEQDEVKLKERLKREGWFICGVFAICLDNSDIITI